MMQQDMIDRLVAAGGKRWQKGDYDRIYFNATSLGLHCEYYKSGNICSAEWNGEEISNRQAYKLCAAKTYVDVKTGEVVSERDELAEAVKAIME